jgi:hypothetical protein
MSYPGFKEEEKLLQLCEHLTDLSDIDIQVAQATLAELNEEATLSKDPPLEPAATLERMMRRTRIRKALQAEKDRRSKQNT